MFVLLFDVFNRCSLVKKWIGKGISNSYYWKELALSKPVGKKQISQKENLKKCSSFEEQKGTRYIRGNVYFALLFSAFVRLQNRVSDFF